MDFNLSKYSYYKQKYLEYKIKRKAGTEIESEPVRNKVKINLFPLSPLGKIKKMFIWSELAEPIDKSQVISKQLVQVQPNNILRRSERLKLKALSSSNKLAWSNSGIINNPPTPLLFTPNTLKSIRSQLDDDIKEIEDQNALDEEEDPEYLEYDRNYGKIIETWFADTQPCPCCKSSNSLRRYSSDIFPIIDLVCINPDHHEEIHGVRYFQVKASNGSLFKGSKYFDLKVPYIFTGSRKAGEPIHLIQPSSSQHDKSFCIGYICVSIKPFESEESSFKIKSIYFVLPNLLASSGSYYYYMDDPQSKSKISWDISNMQIIKSQIHQRLEVPRDYLYNHFYVIKDNPLSFMLNYGNE